MKDTIIHKYDVLHYEKLTILLEISSFDNMPLQVLDEATESSTLELGT